MSMGIRAAVTGPRLVLCALVFSFLCAIWGSARAAEPPSDPSTADSNPVEEVVITGTYDRQKLEQVIIPQFMSSHSAPVPATGQLARWRVPVCPKITGMQPEAADYLTRRIIKQAQIMGAPTAASGKTCEPDIEVLFTSQPQEQLDFIAEKYPRVLGSGRKRGDTLMSRAIQAWYQTGTRSSSPQRRSKCDSATVAQPDPPWGDEAPACGEAGSRLTHHLESELLHVLVIVDQGKLSQTHLQTTADYIAMIALARVGSMDGCSELPSVLDLLATDCARASPEGITAADGAFLRSLYHADLQMDLKFEQSDIRKQMLNELAGH